MSKDGSVRLGRYEVIKPLAQGGMAEVLVARTSGVEGFERYVVIKRIRAEQARDPHYVRMFLDEARLAASLHHQNVVQVYDIGESAGEYFFAMEYIHGEDLRRILTSANAQKTHLPITHVVTIVSAAAAGLHHAHEQRGPDRKPLELVHRDVSPANILVGYDGSVKVVDFGIAKAAHRTAETRSGTLKGKVSYMSPEQCIGNPVDRRSDVFALGIVLWELSTVRRLFKGQSDFVTMNAIVQGLVPKPSLHRPDLPAELEAITLKALAPKPEDRYATCDELRRALEAFADSVRLRTSTTALAGYLKSLLGERALPWESDDDEVELEIVEVDFDGSQPQIMEIDTGTAVLPPDFVPRPSSPLMRAQASETGAQALVPAAPIAPIETTQSNGWSNDKAPTATPMAWVPESPSANETATSPKRRRVFVIAGTAVTLLVVVAIALTRGGSTATPGTQPAPTNSPAPKASDSNPGPSAGDSKAADSKPASDDAKPGDDTKSGDGPKPGFATDGATSGSGSAGGSGDASQAQAGSGEKLGDGSAHPTIGKVGKSGSPKPGQSGTGRPKNPGTGSSGKNPCPRGYDPKSLIPKCK